jgi:hypothetical protein
MADSISGSENADFGLNRFHAVFRVAGHDESQGELRSQRRSSEQLRVRLRQFYPE